MVYYIPHSTAMLLPGSIIAWSWPNGSGTQKLVTVGCQFGKGQCLMNTVTTLVYFERVTPSFR